MQTNPLNRVGPVRPGYRFTCPCCGTSTFVAVDDSIMVVGGVSSNINHMPVDPEPPAAESASSSIPALF